MLVNGTQRSVTPGAGAIPSLRFDRVLPGARDSFRVAAGRPDAFETSRVPAPIDRLGALVATARDTAVDERCITNPVWVAPVAIEVTSSPPPSPGAPLAAGSVRVVCLEPPADVHGNALNDVAKTFTVAR